MPKYYEFKVAGYYLYFTSFCVVECMHVHASNKKLTEAGSAKFFVKGNGDSVLQNKGILTDREISKIQAFSAMNWHFTFPAVFFIDFMHFFTSDLLLPTKQTVTPAFSFTLYVT